MGKIAKKLDVGKESRCSVHLAVGKFSLLLEKWPSFAIIPAACWTTLYYMIGPTNVIGALAVEDISGTQHGTAAIYKATTVLE